MIPDYSYILTIHIRVNYRFDNLKVELLQLIPDVPMSSKQDKQDAVFGWAVESQEAIEHKVKKLKIFMQNSEVHTVTINDRKNDYYLKKSGAIFYSGDLNLTSFFDPSASPKAAKSRYIFGERKAGSIEKLPVDTIEFKKLSPISFIRNRLKI